MLILPSTLGERLAALKAQSQPGYGGTQINAQNQIDNVNAVIVRDYDPNVSPPAYGWTWVNSTSGDTWTSNGTASVSDWIIQGGDGIFGLYGWNQSLVYSATNYRVVAWTSGSINMPDGTVYSISAGNTGNMTLVTYIFLDINVSTTVLQTTTTPANAVGEGRVLVCVAQNNAVTTKLAQFQAFGTNSQSVFITADNIAANTITANEIASNTITATNILTLTMTGKSCTFDTGTIGGWTMGSTTLSASSGGNTTILSSGSTAFTAGPTGSPTITITQAGVLTSVGGTITGGTVQTATSGQRVVLSGSNNRVSFYNSGGTLSGYIEGNTYATIEATQIVSSGYVVISPTNALIVTTPIIVTGLVEPSADGVYTLGTSSFQWEDIYVQDNLVIDGYVLDENAGELRWRGSYVPYATGSGASSGRRVATSSGGAVTTQLGYVELSINGVLTKFLIAP